MSSYLNSGRVPGAGVNSFTGDRALSFQSVDSETIFDSISIADFATAEVDVDFSLSATAFEDNDYIQVLVKGDRADADLVTVTASLSDYTTLDVHRLSVGIPTAWTDVTIQIRTKTDSSTGAERLNLLAVNVVAHGMESASELPGDYAVDRELNPDDLRKLDAVIARQINKVPFDLDRSGQVDKQDRLYWIEKLWNSYVGDANLDGAFDTADFVLVFQAGHYEDDLADAIWETGDWNGDHHFDTADFVLAFQRGGYEEGPRTGALAVPEPDNLASVLTAMVAAIIGLRLPMRFRGQQLTRWRHAVVVLATSRSTRFGATGGRATWLDVRSRPKRSSEAAD